MARGRRFTSLLGVGSAVLGCGLVSYLVLGPTYAYCEGRLDAPLECGTRSMMEAHGVPPAVFGVAIAYFAVGLGSILVASGRASGRWLMLAATVPLVGVGLVSFGLATLLPVTCVAVLATLTAFVSAQR
ncbi:MAG TPA: hypothetical protein VHK06_06330 [Candidatus Limnocylindria bacterium]|nr:hypothetical protein [Candidatus Limnocylindria bacterium]